MFISDLPDELKPPQRWFDFCHKRFLAAGDLKALYCMALKAKHIFEVGVGQGYSTVTVLEACKKTGGLLWSVDDDRSGKCEVAIRNVVRFGLKDYWFFRKANILDYELRRKYDLIYVDITANPEEWKKILPKLLSHLEDNGEVFVHAAKYDLPKMIEDVAGISYNFKHYDDHLNCTIRRS